MAAVVEKILLGSQATLLSTELNSLATNTNSAAGSAYNNTIGGGAGDGYTLCDVELSCTFGANPTANTGISLWFLSTQDGTNYEDGSATVTPGRPPDVVLPVTAGQTGTRTIRRAMLPWGNFKALARNDGTGQTTAASGGTIKVRPVTPEAI
jgi:hypothetical protein